MKKKIKILAQENNQVWLFGEMTNASALSEKKPPLAMLQLCSFSDISSLSQVPWNYVSFGKLAKMESILSKNLQQGTNHLKNPQVIEIGISQTSNTTCRHCNLEFKPFAHVFQSKRAKKKSHLCQRIKFRACISVDFEVLNTN